MSFVDFESPAERLDFGIQDQSGQDNSRKPEQNQSQASGEPDKAEQDEDEEKDGKREELLPQEVNALYERLLQEMESRSEPLQQEIRLGNPRASGRDY